MKRSWNEHIAHGAEKLLANSQKVYRHEWERTSDLAKTRGPCRCGPEGAVTGDGGSVVYSPFIEGAVDCLDVHCNEYLPQTDRALERGPRKTVSRKALRSLKDSVWIDGYKFDGKRIARIAANLPGEALYAVTASAQPEGSQNRQGYLYLQGNGWRAIVMSTVTDPRSRLPVEQDIDLETLSEPAKKPPKTSVERVDRAFQKVRTENARKGRYGSGMAFDLGFSRPCRCGDRRFMTSGFRFVAGKAQGDEPKCTSGSGSAMCEILASARSSLGTKKPISLGKLRKLAQANKGSNVYLGEDAYDADRLLQIIDGFGSGKARVGLFQQGTVPTNVLVLEDPNDEWAVGLAPIRTDVTSNIPKANVQEFLDRQKTWPRVAYDDLAGSLIGHDAHGRRAMSELDAICRNGGCQQRSMSR